MNVPPLLVQLPAILMEEAVPAERLVPEPMVRLPFKFIVVVEPPTVRALVFDVVRLLKVCDADVPFIAWAPEPLKVTVTVPGVNVPAVLAQSPVTLMAVAVPAAKVPLVRVRVLIFNVVVLPATLKVWAVLATVML